MWTDQVGRNKLCAVPAVRAGTAQSLGTPSQALPSVLPIDLPGWQGRAWNTNAITSGVAINYIY